MAHFTMGTGGTALPADWSIFTSHDPLPSSCHSKKLLWNLSIQSLSTRQGYKIPSDTSKCWLHNRLCTNIKTHKEICGGNVWTSGKCPQTFTIDQKLSRVWMSLWPLPCTLNASLKVQCWSCTTCMHHQVRFPDTGQVRGAGLHCGILPPRLHQPEQAQL